MPSSEKNTFRFAFGSAGALYASVWRLWVHGDDVYLAARHMEQTCKVSLHASGLWRIAWTAEANPGSATGGDRLIRRWQSPPNVAPGWSHAMSIVFPPPSTNSPFPLLPEDAGKPIRWLEPAGDRTLNVAVLMSNTRQRPVPIHRLLSGNETALTLKTLRNQRQVALLLRYQESDPKLIEWVQSTMKELCFGMSAPDAWRAGGVLRISHDAESDRPIVYSFALGAENFYHAPPTVEPNAGNKLAE